MRLTLIIILVFILIIFTTLMIIKLYPINESSDISIIVILKSKTEGTDFWNMVKKGIKSASNEYEVKVKVIAPLYESDVEGQIKLVEESIKEKPDVIILAATDYKKLVPISKKVVYSKIKLITLDSDIKSNISEGLIATNNYKAGIKAGNILSGIINSDDTIAIISHIKGSATAIYRENGVRSELNKFNQKNILDTVYSDNSIENSYNLTKNLLNNNNNIGGIIALNETTTVGVAMAVEENKSYSNIKIVGFDGSIDEVKYIEKGIIHSTIIQNPYNMGYSGIKAAVKVSKGNKINKYLDTGSFIINKNNLYEPENEKLLFPFY
ncbi:MAG: substrate-binding domain-containing protein [Clostridiales bacterium]